MTDILPKVTCTYCQEEVNGVRVQCCECPEFDICLQCFAAGAEIGPHKNDHSYKFVDQGSVSIFNGRGNWTGREHLRLLEAAELYSYTNWELVAEHVETKTAEECREEYTARYLDGNIGKAMWANIQKPNLFIDLVEDDGPLSQASLAKLAPLDATHEEAKMLGYKPHRDDFEREYDPAAEQLVADLQLDEHDETELEKALKLAVVDMYVRRLRERQRRKRIVRDYQLVAKYFDNLRRDPSQPLYAKDQKELRDHFKVFTQFLNSGEHDRLIASIERERELRHRLSELKRYRGLGLTTQEEIVHYEQHAAFQRQQIRQGKAGSSGSAAPLHQRPSLYLTSEEGDVAPVSSSTAERTTWQYGSDSGYDNEGSADDEAMGSPGATSLPRDPSSTTTPTPILETTSSPTRTTVPSPTRSNSGAEELEGLEGRDPRLEPMGRWLSEGETQLCTILDITPVTYVTMKSLIIQDNLLNPEKYQESVKPDQDESECCSAKDELTKFLRLNGWLPRVSTNLSSKQEEDETDELEDQDTLEISSESSTDNDINFLESGDYYSAPDFSPSELNSFSPDYGDFPSFNVECDSRFNLS
ncbi:transcriptional adapter 2B isoform X3 [Anthonomus grandis grandis]|uniref:transcriptional adapter 2B isoform X1 n=1 Tax=Anthonomus grandis grandis TaxID=2921223 RepID=UPI0021669AA5|nr:transcriptional adapter 2B isoform X1 [Anthonomus grandis grandis]XP_050305417.1 transcriptional adapter 2B isoform X2 [Anthonomus grandis grandis]XP_050305418.1 transcriptional adapter 2B isoform X3 [Anthonomus grandis grandis]